MHLLVVGTDTKLFDERSEVRRRVEEYAKLFDGLHIVVYTPPGFYETHLSNSAVVYPTNSRWFFLRPLDAFRITKAILRNHRIDVVSAQDPAESGIAGWLIARSGNIPLHIQLHADFFSAHFRRNSWKERLRYFLARHIVPRGNCFRVVSERIRQSLMQEFRIPASKISLLPIFVDCGTIAAAKTTSNLRAKYPEFDFVILIVSRLVREKNIPMALAAFRELLREFPKSGLVIVGDGPERTNIESEIRNQELGKSAHVMGWRDDTTPYYKGADLYLLTSNFEGYSRSVIEAAAAGASVVMTDVGVAGWVIRDGETGAVVPVGNTHALTQALITARRNPSRVRQMAERAQREVCAMPPRTREEYLARYRDSFSCSKN